VAYHAKQASALSSVGRKLTGIALHDDGPPALAALMLAAEDQGSDFFWSERFPRQESCEGKRIPLSRSGEHHHL